MNMSKQKYVVLVAERVAAQTSKPIPGEELVWGRDMVKLKPLVQRFGARLNPLLQQ